MPKGWEARVVRDWCADKGIILVVAPAKAHNWLGVVERKHQVVRRSLELYMDELGGATLPALKEACIYVPPRIRCLSPEDFLQHNGFLDEHRHKNCP